MKYLLLGGAGFVGRALSYSLQTSGHEVIVVDDMSTANPNAPRLPGVRIIESSVQAYPELGELVSWADVVYFLAGSVGVKHVVENPYDTLMNNISLMVYIVDWAKKYDKPIIFTSTSEVYGQGPFVEDGVLHIGPPSNLRWGYASAKLTTEFAVAASGCRYKILRLFNVTGPGQIGDYGMVLPRFIRAALTNDNINVYGTGAQRRSFCHVRDAVVAIRAVEALPGNEIVNIGSDIATNATSILDLAHRIKGLINTTSPVVCRPYDQVFVRDSGDIADRVPDLTKLLTLTDYRATQDLDTIILEVAADQLSTLG